MATAVTTHWGISAGERLAAKLVRTLAGAGRAVGRDGSRSLATWTPADKLARPNGWKPVKLARAIREAEDAGLISIAVRENGRAWLRLTILAAGVFGLGLEDDADRVGTGDAPGDSPHAAIVSTLAGMATACPLAEALVGRMGCDVEDAWQALQAAERAGLVETWPDHPAGPSATLSALSAARIGLRLASDASRWIASGAFDPTEVDPPLKFAVETDVSEAGGPGRLDALPDPKAVGGLDAMAIQEAAGRGAEDCRRAMLEDGPAARSGPRPKGVWADYDPYATAIPSPRILLGLSIAWPVLIEMGEVCPGCRNEPLGPATACLLCLRSGVDHLLGDPDDPPDPAEGDEPPPRRIGPRGRRR